MTDLYHSILDYLFSFGLNNKEIDLKDFLKTLSDIDADNKKDGKRVGYILSQLQSRYITYSFQRINQLCNTNPK